MIELERTFLAKSIPDLSGCSSKELIDIYIPQSSHHPVLRIRRSGEKYEITKKTCINGNDSSEMLEQTIVLDKDEFASLSTLQGKLVEKTRFNYPHQGLIAEIDVFKGALAGLVLIDFEFKTIDEKNAFKMPSFCLCEVTQEEFLAGGMLCGKAYADIEKELKRFKYRRITTMS